jgi:preprotein translocase subunit SecY
MAMGVYPYITAQIILQLIVPIIPALKERMGDRPQERQKWMEKWTMLLAIPMAALQAIGQINIFNTLAGVPVIPDFGLFGSNWLESWMIIFSMTAGTMFAIWLGELISEFGLRNQGLSLIIFAGIVSRIPATILQLMSDEQYRFILLFLLIVITSATVFAIVFVQQGTRNIPVMYPGRRVGNRMSMPVKGTFPLMVNMAGMIPIIFAQSLLTFPAIIASFFVNSQVGFIKSVSNVIYTSFGGQNNVYWIMYFVMVVAFTFFYSNVLFTQQNYGEELKKAGAQIPGVSPGGQTQRYLNRVLSRITLPGALFLGIVAILPWLLSIIIPLGNADNLLLVSSAGLIIVVGVVRDAFKGIEADLQHRYRIDDAVLIK